MARRSGRTGGSSRSSSKSRPSRARKGPHKSAITGRFISSAAAARHPKTSYSLGSKK